MCVDSMSGLRFKLNIIYFVIQQRSSNSAGCTDIASETMSTIDNRKVV